MERLRVLIIENDRDTAEFFQRMLDLFGFDCELVLSAKKALAVLATSVPDVVLLDMRLDSEIGGEDILYQIRSNPRMSRTRVIVVTAYPTSTELVSNLADLILVKPVEVEQLRTLVQRLGSLTPGAKQNQFKDPITELYNQEFFYTRLDLAFERARRRSDFYYGVVVFKLMVYKAAQAEEVPDEQVEPELQFSLMRLVSGRMRFNSRPMDTLARLSGLKFASLHEELNDPQDVNAILQRFQEKLAEPFLVNGEMYTLKASFGAAVHASHWRHSEDVLEAADQALGVASVSGPGGIYIVGLPVKSSKPA